MKLEYYLFATNECNLNCGYCSIIEDTKKNKIPMYPTYNLQKLKNFIQKTQKFYKSNTLDIIFFGGEPSLNIEFVKKVIKEIGNTIEYSTVNYIFHTNGLNLKKIDRNLLSKFQIIMISINYEKIPTYNLQNSYFGEIVSNIKYTKDNTNAILVGRLTVTEKVSLYMNILQISNFFDYVYWQIQNCVKFENFNTFYNTYSFELDLIWDYWFRYFSIGSQINFIPFIALSRLEFNNTFFNNKFLCGYNEFMIYILTNGNCYSCAEEIFNTSHFLIGDIINGITFKPQKVSTITLCKECPYLKLCHGRCGRMHERFKLSHIKEYCELNSLLFKKILSNKTQIIEIYQKYPHLVINLENNTLLATEYVP